jgi:hypothetical protein
MFIYPNACSNVLFNGGRQDIARIRDPNSWYSILKGAATLDLPCRASCCGYALIWCTSISAHMYVSVNSGAQATINCLNGSFGVLPPSIDLFLAINIAGHDVYVYSKVLTYGSTSFTTWPWAAIKNLVGCSTYSALVPGSSPWDA